MASTVHIPEYCADCHCELGVEDGDEFCNSCDPDRDAERESAEHFALEADMAFCSGCDSYVESACTRIQCPQSP